jgi:hypothetical protein
MEGKVSRKIFDNINKTTQGLKDNKKKKKKKKP